MPHCSKCGEAFAFHELTNFDVLAPKDGTKDTTERLCFRCVQKAQSSYEMHRAALREALERAERAEAELERVKKAAGELAHGVQRLLQEHRVIQAMVGVSLIDNQQTLIDALAEALADRDKAKVAVAKLEAMLAHAEERVKHNYEVAERRSKVAAEMREALKSAEEYMLCYKLFPPIEQVKDALARAKEAWL